MSGRSAAAVAELARAAQGSRSPSVWSDYAAALLVRSDETDDGDACVEALGAANRALSIDPRFAPALFNRALALDRLRLIATARAAWREFLTADGNSDWSDEALRHLHELGSGNDADEWKRRFGSLRGAPENVIVDATRRFPQQARTWSEVVVMGDWADATLKDDRSSAAASLRLATIVANTLRAQSGESLLRDAVAVAEGVQGTPAAGALAHAYVEYRAGRLAHAASHAADAEAKLRNAQEAFARCGSPMQSVAGYFVASALHAQLRLREAAVLLDAMAAQNLDRRGYLALSGMIGWERGSCAVENGAISRGINIFTRSRDVFRRLGERDFAATMDAFLAACYDLTGERRAAWRSRRDAFEVLSRSGNQSRLLVVIESAASSATEAGRWREAEALLALTVAGAERARNAPVAAHAYAQRARVGGELGDPSAARQDLQSGYRWAALIKDAAGRQRAEADLALADGAVTRASDPRAALARLDQGIHYYEQAGRRVELSKAYLDRAKAFVAMNDVLSAQHDVDAGIAIVALERRELRDLEQRASLLATADSLFDLAISLAMRNDDAERAFGFVEQRNARALADMFELGSAASDAEVAPLPLSRIREALSPGTAIVSYVPLPDRLLILAVTRDGLGAKSVAIDRDALTRVVEDFRRAIDVESPDAVKAGTAAGALLLDPIRDVIANAQRVVLVTGPRLSGLPAAALVDGRTGHFLIEDVAVATAPSASLLVAASRREGARRGRSAVAVSGDAFDAASHPELRRLPRVREESTIVARCYRSGEVIAGAAATRAAVSRALREHAVVHFAGHAIPSTYPARAAILLAPSQGDGGEVSVADIARLRLASTRVVVLAACASAAPVERGDGAENLARAFIAAGAPTVVATLRKLDDDVSPTFMVPLHQRLAAGEDPVSAVRQVLLGRVRDANGRVRLPLSWSNFVVVGGSAEFVGH